MGEFRLPASLNGVPDALVLALAKARWVRETDPLYPDSWDDESVWVRGPYVSGALLDLEQALPVLARDEATVERLAEVLFERYTAGTSADVWKEDARALLAGLFSSTVEGDTPNEHADR